MTGVVLGDQGGKPGPFGMMDVPHRPAAPAVQVNVRPTVIVRLMTGGPAP
jgi:hypothetical protein